MVDNTNKYKDILIPIIEKYLPTCRILIFGSRAIMQFQEGADIDVAIDDGKPIASRLIFRILDDIEESSLPVFVDVIDFQSASEDLKKEILRDGVVWKN